MSFGESISTVFKKYADFSGRARRSEYWWFALFLFLVGAGFSSIESSFAVTGFDVFALGSAELTNPMYALVVSVSSLWSVAVLIPSIAVGVRRLHDSDMSGWWLLIGLIPLVGWILVIVWLAQDGQGADNRFGADPKAEERMAVAA